MTSKANFCQQGHKGTFESAGSLPAAASQLEIAAILIASVLECIALWLHSQGKNSFARIRLAGISGEDCEKMLVWAVDGLTGVVLGSFGGAGGGRPQRAPRAVLWGQHAGQLSWAGKDLCLSPPHPPQGCPPCPSGTQSMQLFCDLCSGVSIATAV